VEAAGSNPAESIFNKSKWSGASNLEVEVKAKLAGTAGLNAIKQKLGGLKARLVEELVQHDEYYYREPDRKTRGPGDFIVRIRKQGNENYLGYKELTETTGAWKEYESRVEDAEAVKKILKGIGLVKAFDVIKKRSEYRAGEFEVCLDDVKDLGCFIEVALEFQKEIDGESSKNAREKIYGFMKTLGISEKDLEPKGYGELIHEPLGYKFVGMN